MPALSNAVLFTAGFVGGASGVYHWRDGVLHRIVRTGDVVDGRTVESVLTSAEALDHDYLVFQASFTDLSRGVYATSVPEPGTVAMAGLAGAVALGWRWRRRRQNDLAAAAAQTDGAAEPDESA